MAPTTQQEAIDYVISNMDKFIESHFDKEDAEREVALIIANLRTGNIQPNELADYGFAFDDDVEFDFYNPAEEIQLKPKVKRTFLSRLKGLFK